MLTSSRVDTRADSALMIGIERLAGASSSGALSLLIP